MEIVCPESLPYKSLFGILHVPETETEYDYRSGQFRAKNRHMKLNDCCYHKNGWMYEHEHYK